MDEDKRVTRPLSDERRRNDCLAESRGGSQHPMFMRGERIECLDLWTIQLALALLRANQRSVDYGLIAAGVIISMIPIYIVVILFQDRIMSGMLTGAIKE